MRNMTLTNAQLTTGDQVLFDQVRVIVRGDYARALDRRGQVAWEAALTGWVKDGKVYRFTLLDGPAAEAVSLGCGSCGH